MGSSPFNANQSTLLNSASSMRSGPVRSIPSDILAAAGNRTVVAVVRDAHRHPWMTEALDALVAVRPQTIVVEMGLPRAAPRGALYIATHGAARVCGKAAAEVIAGV